MNKILEQYSTNNFKKIFEEIDFRFLRSPKEKWDERTFYITISLQYKNDSQSCDLIFLVDRDEFTAAFSLNNDYKEVRKFFLKHFDYHLLYSDEMYFAKQVSKNFEFQTYVKEFFDTYPKYAATFQSTLK